MLCHFLLLSQDFVQQLSIHCLWFLRWHHRNYSLANPCHILFVTHTPQKFAHTNVYVLAAASSIAGRGTGRETKCRWNLRRCCKLEASDLLLPDKGNFNYWWTKLHHILLRPVCFKHLSTVNKVTWILKLALHFASCVLFLDADQLSTLQIKHTNALQHTGTHTEGFLADCKFLPFPTTHT